MAQDNRLQFPPTKIDFSDDVGLTGQDHESVPQPGQARYDHILMWMIGLLAHQSSEYSSGTGLPNEARVGSIWYPSDLDSFLYTKDNGSTWQTIADAIAVAFDADNPDDIVSLSEWYATAKAILDGVLPKLMWRGSSNNYSVESIPIPSSLASIINPLKDSLTPLVYKNGLLLDPTHTRFSSCCTLVELLSGEKLDKGDKFIVIVEKFDYTYTGEVTAE